MPATIEYKARCRQGGKLATFTIPALPIDECAGCRARYFGGPADEMITEFLNNLDVPKEYEEYKHEARN